MGEKTARKYRDSDGLLSQQSSDRNYRTRTDPFAEVWPIVERQRLSHALEAVVTRLLQFTVLHASNIVHRFVRRLRDVKWSCTLAAFGALASVLVS